MIYVLLLLAGLDPAAQADALLDYVSDVPPLLTNYTVDFDPSGHLWLFGKFGEDYYVSRISPEGEVVLDRVLIRNMAALDSRPTFDPHGSAWLVPSFGVGDMGNYPVDVRLSDSAQKPMLTPVQTWSHLIRVTAEGEVMVYSPWPALGSNNAAAMVSEDTLLILAADGNSVWVTDGVVSADGIEPGHEAQGFREPEALYTVMRLSRNKDYTRAYMDWGARRGLRAEIYWYASYADRGPDIVNMFYLDLRSQTNYRFTSVGNFGWREYVWRSFRNAPIRHMSFFRYGDGGYVLAIPDIEDRSVTHLVRVDDEGRPVDPETLGGGGRKSARAFKRIPDGVERYVDLLVWRSDGEELDSARVLYWGVDTEGNLYEYKAAKRF